MRTVILFFSVSLLVSLSACKNTKIDSQSNRIETDSRIKFIGKYELDIPEPSGLAYNSKGNFLWTVSDENSSLYKISTNGECVDSIKLDGIDLEGVSHFRKNELCVITERDRGLLFLDSTGVIQNRIILDLNGNPNEGIEGITYNPNNNHLYILNEKNPVLLVELDENYEIVNKNVASYADDFSGLNYDSTSNALWIISDEESRIYKTDLEGKVLDSYYLGLPQIEGIALDLKNQLIYIVSDITECLYIYKLIGD